VDFDNKHALHLCKRHPCTLTFERQPTDWREQVTTWRDLRGLLYSHSDVCVFIKLAGLYWTAKSQYIFYYGLRDFSIILYLWRQFKWELSCFGLHSLQLQNTKSKLEQKTFQHQRNYLKPAIALNFITTCFRNLSNGRLTAAVDIPNIVRERNFIVSYWEMKNIEAMPYLVVTLALWNFKQRFQMQGQQQFDLYTQNSYRERSDVVASRRRALRCRQCVWEKCVMQQASDRVYKSCVRRCVLLWHQNVRKHNMVQYCSAALTVSQLLFTELNVRSQVEII
jgi:hypothetical protein